MSFNKNVFINCTFTDDYRVLLRPLLFTVLSCGFDPQISETKDSGDNRIVNSKDLIRSSRFSIHDLSGSGPMKDGEYPQFNMPYELGLDIGCKEYGVKNIRPKNA